MVDVGCKTEQEREEELNVLGLCEKADTHPDCWTHYAEEDRQRVLQRSGESWWQARREPGNQVEAQGFHLSCSGVTPGRGSWRQTKNAASVSINWEKNSINSPDMTVNENAELFG